MDDQPLLQPSQLLVLPATTKHRGAARAADTAHLSWGDLLGLLDDCERAALASIRQLQLLPLPTTTEMTAADEECGDEPPPQHAHKQQPRSRLLHRRASAAGSSVGRDGSEGGGGGPTTRPLDYGDSKMARMTTTTTRRRSSVEALGSTAARSVAVSPSADVYREHSGEDHGESEGEGEEGGEEAGDEDGFTLAGGARPYGGGRRRSFESAHRGVAAHSPPPSPPPPVPHRHRRSSQGPPRSRRPSLDSLSSHARGSHGQQQQQWGPRSHAEADDDDYDYPVHGGGQGAVNPTRRRHPRSTGPPAGYRGPPLDASPGECDSQQQQQQHGWGNARHAAPAAHPSAPLRPLFQPGPEQYPPPPPFPQQQQPQPQQQGGAPAAYRRYYQPSWTAGGGDATTPAWQHAPPLPPPPPQLLQSQLQLQARRAGVAATALLTGSNAAAAAAAASALAPPPAAPPYVPARSSAPPPEAGGGGGRTLTGVLRRYSRGLRALFSHFAFLTRKVGREPTFDTLAQRAPCLNRAEFARAVRDLGLQGPLLSRSEVEGIARGLVTGHGSVLLDEAGFIEGLCRCCIAMLGGQRDLAGRFPSDADKVDAVLRWCVSLS